ncbi:MAG: DUF4878 domain-containing protein [Campylobacterota bacterium]|nr:DUF4878 domain-containing protein [Campylobacterota bacterium]
MTLTKTVLISTISLLLIGCSATPEDAVQNVYDSIKEGDMPKLIKNSSYEIRNPFIRSALFECSVDKSKYTGKDLELVQDCLKEKYGGIHVEIGTANLISQTEADINVTMQSNTRVFNHQLKVVKIENKWKVVTGKRE